jgi:hypothetical protein
VEEDETKNIPIKPVTKTILYISLILILLSFSTIDPFAFASQKIVNLTYDAKEVPLQFFPEATLFFTGFITRRADISPNLDATQASFIVRVIPIVVHLRAAFWT